MIDVKLVILLLAERDRTFAFEVVAGAAIGLAAAWLATRARRLVDGGGETALTLLTPFIAYIPADAVGASGVLAAVAAGSSRPWRRRAGTGRDATCITRRSSSSCR